MRSRAALSALAPGSRPAAAWLALGELTLDMTKLARLLVPAAKSLDGPVDPLESTKVGHFACYKAKPAKGQPKHAKRAGVHVNHQLGPAQLDTVKEEELCLPSNVSLVN